MMGSLSAGYVQRAMDELPRQGQSGPWKVTHAFEHDQPMLLQDPIDDGFLEFGFKEAPALSA